MRRFKGQVGTTGECFYPNHNLCYACDDSQQRDSIWLTDPILFLTLW